MSDADPADLERARILGETGQIAWSELQRWFAAGMAIYVSPDLDLVETAFQLSSDNTTHFSDWMAAGRIDKVSDDRALAWFEAEAIVWAVVVKPWVLVQPIVPGAEH